MYTLHGEDPELTAKIEELRALALLDGIQFDTAPFGGVRTEADTVRILKYRDDDYAKYEAACAAQSPPRAPTEKALWRPIAPFGLSMHNYGAARDVKIVKKPDSFSEAEALRRLGSLAPQCRLRWGGTFQKKIDPPHFQLPITLSAANARWTPTVIAGGRASMILAISSRL
mgnify:CR=1 FL=1